MVMNSKKQGMAWKTTWYGHDKTFKWAHACGYQTELQSLTPKNA